MKLQEAQSKQLFAERGIPIPSGEVVDTATGAQRVAQSLEGPVVVKAQVLVGGRGKAGGIQVAKTPEEAERVASEVLGMKIKGFDVRSVLIEAAADIERELYLGVTVDRGARRHVLMASAEGGVEIEEVARSSPEAIHRVTIDPCLGVLTYQLRSLAAELGLDDEQHRAFYTIARTLVDVLIVHDATLAEINPLVVTTDGELLALDGKMVIDDNALFRHPDLAEMRNVSEETKAERRAREAGLSYVDLDGEIGCMVNGAGLAMATMDVIKHFGGAPANFLDIGGGAQADRVATALELILADEDVSAVLFNVFGGITRCDEVARGILSALEAVKPDVPLVARLVGTNEAEGRDLLERSSYQLMAAETLADAARKAVEAAYDR